MKRIALLLVVAALAGCEEDVGPLETDISEANRATECPVDVSEADRADYPACN